ncbi:MAG TPA: fumarate reductase/succinate dehydrogenase flavoprotein subunit [Candidatus Acidoferrales bacterium]|jgi:succinate dehydrogenase / fumarate reductase flavoprotein subunit|nr:fumarate reductase/succinate dehydrogenase flavoprotein subunit [Candidatus Acidoferrales bacterium]
MELNSHAPTGPIEQAWDKHKFELKLVNPANKRKYNIIVVGCGLAGGAAAASLGELGYNVQCFCYQDSPRRAHSIAAQGGINAAKNYHNDGDSIFRLFYDTVKGGDFRSREANVYRLAQVSVNIIDQCVAQGVPFAREYGGLLDNRSFGGAQVSRTFYARGQTGQQLLLGAYQALERQIGLGTVTMNERTEMLDLIVVDGQARGIVTRDLCDGKIEVHIADAVILATGGYGNVFYLSTNAKGCNATAIWRAYKRGALFANPCFTQIHPTCIPVAGEYQSKLTLMSESLRNDGRIWVPKKPGDKRPPASIPEDERDYYLERRYPSFGNLVPRDIASRAAKAECDAGHGVGETGLGVYLDFSEAMKRLGQQKIAERYGNLFEMYERITGENPYEVPMRIYPAIHYTMGGLWVDYNLMSTIPGLFVLGEANFSDHGANRLGASALMQGLADGYFIIPYTIGNYLATAKPGKVAADAPAVKEAVANAAAITKKLLNGSGTRTVDSFHRELGKIVWDYCGMARNEAGLKKALTLIPALREEFWKNVKVLGTNEEFNQSLEKAGRVADFFELAELMCRDALERNESCGGHFREEFQTPEGEALRDDDHYSYVSAWEYQAEGAAPALNKEPLTFEYVHPSQRSYK